MRNCADEETPNIFPMHRLALLLAGSVGIAWFMVPKQNELVERLIKDRRYERVVALLQAGSEGGATVDLGGLRKLDGAHLSFITRLLKLTAREQLHTIFDERLTMDYDTYIHRIALAAIRYVDVLPPQEVYDFITPRLAKVPEPMRLDLLRLIAKNANAVGNPALAAHALLEASHAKAAGWSLVQEMIRDYRWSNQPQDALAELGKWLGVHGSSLKKEERAAADDLYFMLALECNKPSKALDICLEIAKTMPSGSTSAALWLERARSTALACDRTQELLVPMQKYLDGLPESRLSQTELHGAWLHDPAKFSTYQSWLTDMAHWSDWNSHFDAAYDTHEKLAAMGSVESLDRCLDLQSFVGRGDSCASLLKTLGDVPGHPQLLATRAHILAETGDNEEARACFEAWMKMHPDDANAGMELAALLDDMGDHVAAHTTLEKLFERQSDDMVLMKKLAQARVRQLDYTGALTLYEKLPADAHTKETLENYAMIAESLDDHAARFRALELILQVLKRPDTRLFLNLANAASYLSDPKKSLSVLRDGLAQLPQSAALRIALGDSMLNAGKTDEALETLLVDSLKNNFEAVQILLSMVREIPDVGQILAFIGSDVNQRLPLTARNRIQLAELCHLTGHPDEERLLYASVPEMPGNFQILAESRYFLSDFDGASRLLLAHLQSHPRAAASEWMFLGDIFEQSGHAAEAQQAYDRSITLLTADLPDTASN